MTCVAHNQTLPCIKCTLAKQRLYELERAEQFWRTTKMGLILAGLWTAAIIAYC